MVGKSALSLIPSCQRNSAPSAAPTAMARIDFHIDNVAGADRLERGPHGSAAKHEAPATDGSRRIQSSGDPI